MNEFLIQKFSLFVDKQCKSLLSNIIEIVDGSSFPTNETIKEKPIKTPIEELEKLSNLSISDKLCCTVCNHPLFDRDEQVSHYKSDLHRFNLKRKLKGLVCLTAEEFEKLSDVSSISGSDSCDDDDDYQNRSDDDDFESDTEDSKNDLFQVKARSLPKIAFKLSDSNVLVMHRCLLHGKKNTPENVDDVIQLAKSISNQDQWCIILVNAGHFASAIFKGEESIIHKTFHRYVIRAKRGTVQSVHDKAGGHARSAGANIRRHHEAAFKDDIKSLMEQWKKELDKCKCIFLRAPKYNHQIFFTGKTAIFSKFDSRIRNIPFMTFRPTLNEIKRAHFTLRTLELYNSFYTLNEKPEGKKASGVNQPHKNEDLGKLIKSNTDKLERLLSSTTSSENDYSDNELAAAVANINKKNKKKRKLKTIEKDEIKKQKESSPLKNENIEQKEQKVLDSESQKVFNEFYSSCITNDAEKLSSLIEKYKIMSCSSSSSETYLDRVINYRFDVNGLTLLHLTSSLGYVECVKTLLANGSDPTISTINDERRVPYLLSKTKAVRDQFRRFMYDYPLLYDYSLAKIPSGLSKEMEAEKINKEKEKRRLQRKVKKEKDEDAKSQQKQIQFENEEKAKFLSLNDEEKRLLMIERKFISSKNSKEKDKLLSGSQATIKLKNNNINPERMPVIISRCWYCAENLSTNVPFEYYDYKFCSVKCLKSHRQQNNKNKN